MKACFLVMLSFLVASSSLAQLPYTENQVIEYAKSVDVHTLDTSLPSQRLEHWLRSGPPHVHIRDWIVSDTCDLKEPKALFPNGDWPICARVSFFRDGEIGFLLLQLGTAKKGIFGRPCLYQSFGVWNEAMVLRGNSERLSDLPALIGMK
jgi:hypothetical protein